MVKCPVHALTAIIIIIFKLRAFVSLFTISDKIIQLNYYFLLQYNKKNAPLFFRNPFILKDAEWKENRADLSPGFTVPKVNYGFCGMIVYFSLLLTIMQIDRQNHCIQSLKMCAVD